MGQLHNLKYSSRGEIANTKMYLSLQKKYCRPTFRVHLLKPLCILREAQRTLASTLKQQQQIAFFAFNIEVVKRIP